MTPDELAKQKTFLEARLNAISMSNVYGRSLDEITALNLDHMKTERSLFAIERQIRDYIEGKSS